MNFRIFFLAACFWVLETAYFGWNLSPQSDAEVVCDGIVMMLAAIAYLVPQSNSEY